MQVLYLGYFCPDPFFDQLYANDKDISIATHKFEMQLIQNILKQKSIELSVVSSLSYSNSAIEKKTVDSFGEKTTIHYVWKKRGGMLDLDAMKRAKELIDAWLETTDGQERIILTYATNPILLWSLALKKRPVKVVTICSEVPQYRIDFGNPIKVALKKRVWTYINNRMDAYVFFTEHMAEVANPKDRPFIVVEGLPDIRISASEIEMKSPQQKESIFYAGYLHAENGIEVLLDAFQQLENEGVSLMLCGTGGSVDRIKELARVDKRIQYLGALPNDRVLQLEREATLLINPRKPGHLLTRYSFPSKTFEYFTSGTPAIITKLDGIPDEYYRYCYTCDVSSARTLAADLESVLSVPLEERSRKAKDAFAFIEREKSAESQTQKILAFLKDIVRGE